jgi:outer membrane protein assembly factor BamB
MLLVLLDQGSGDDGLSALIALEAHSGKTVWQTQRPVPNSWASPIVINTGGREEIVTCGSPWVIGYDPATGTELWRADCLGGDVAPSPIYANGLVFGVNASYYLAAIRPGGQGDVTKTHIAWTAEEGLPDICSPVSNGELVFLLTTYGGILTCYDAQDGSLVWENKLGTAFRSSPTLVGNRLYLMSQSGVMFIVEAGREYQELGSAELGEASNACPAFLDGRIYIRGKEHLYCIGE